MKQNKNEYTTFKNFGAEQKAVLTGKIIVVNLP